MRRERHHDSSFVMPFGKSSRIRDRFQEYTFTFQEVERPFRKLGVIFRLYDDGVAFRYRLPQQPHLHDFWIGQEDTELALVGEPVLYALPLPFSSSYEAYYKIGHWGDFAAESNLGLPLALSFPNHVWAAVTEADLLDYAGLYFMPSKEKSNHLVARLAPSLLEPQVKVRGRTPFVSPWRTIVIGDSPAVLVESDMVIRLASPSRIQETAWIHSGKVQFAWWNGYVVPGAADKAGLNTWTIKHYIDFCAANGIAFHSLDGYEMEQAWYGGRVLPYVGADITKARAEIDLPEVLRYAREKGVGTRLWLHSEALWNADLDRLFALYESWGIQGIMPDFLNRDDQAAVRFFNRIVQMAAQHHLTVSFHGVSKPTGLNRTYPNLLSQEAVLGTEYNKWSAKGSPPDHEVLAAYIRMLAGPLDTHEGSFRPVSPQKFVAQTIAPRAMGTLARQLALYVIFENHLPMLADYPEAYLRHPSAFQFVKQVPVDWDETRWIAGEVGKSLVLARRKGNDWYLGAINDGQAQTFDLSLGWLGPGIFSGEMYRDTPFSAEDGEQMRTTRQTLDASQMLRLELTSAGGAAVRLHRIDLAVTKKTPSRPQKPIKYVADFPRIE